jgi:uncharacterized SAM-binding protein YcdF (DUF218 family)
VLFFLFAIATVVSLRFALRARHQSGWRRLPVLTPLLCLALAALAAPRGSLLVKSIGSLLMPIGLIWVALLALAIGAWWRERPRLLAVFAALALALTLAGSDPLSEWLNGALEAEHAWARPLSADPFDAVIVLGGSTDDTPAGDPHVTMSGDRVVLGARLYHRGLTPLLVTSGSPIEGLTDHDAVSATAQIWRDLGVPDDAIVRVLGARTTSEEASLHARLIRERGWRRVGLVTSAFHERRALALFEARGVHLVPVPADVRTRPPGWHGFYSLVPKGIAAHYIHDDCWELLGRLGGR